MTARPGDDPDASLQAHTLADLPALVALLERACARVGADTQARADLRLAAEEVFTNILCHGYGGGPGRVSMTVLATPQQVTLTLRDAAPNFDPASLSAPDLHAGWQARPLGGLGWHLVRQVMDEVRHTAARPRGNVYTLVRRLQRPPAPPDAP